MMQREGIHFAEVDIDNDPGAADLVMQANGGNRTVPTLLFPDGTALTNPSITLAPGLSFSPAFIASATAWSLSMNTPGSGSVELLRTSGSSSTFPPSRAVTIALRLALGE